MKYRTKPVIKEAQQLTFENMKTIMRWCDGRAWSRPPCRAITGIKIKTLEGDMHAEFGDYIVKGLQGEFYPVKPDIFEESYEPVGDDES